MAALDTFLFTSESVNEGHPDKLCDQVRSACVRLPGPCGGPGANWGARDGKARAESRASSGCVLNHSTRERRRARSDRVPRRGARNPRVDRAQS